MAGVLIVPLRYPGMATTGSGKDLVLFYSGLVDELHFLSYHLAFPV